MLWTDVNEIAIELCEKYPEIDPQYVLFTDLRDWVIGLDGFKGHADRSNEKIKYPFISCNINIDQLFK